MDDGTVLLLHSSIAHLIVAPGERGGGVGTSVVSNVQCIRAAALSSRSPRWWSEKPCKPAIEFGDISGGDLSSGFSPYDVAKRRCCASSSSCLL